MWDVPRDNSVACPTGLRTSFWNSQWRAKPRSGSCRVLGLCKGTSLGALPVLLTSGAHAESTWGAGWPRLPVPRSRTHARKGSAWLTARLVPAGWPAVFSLWGGSASWPGPSLLRGQAGPLCEVHPDSASCSPRL